MTNTKPFHKFIKSVKLKKELMTSVKISRGPCDDNGGLKLTVRKVHSIKPNKVGISNMRYDGEKNHEFLREELNARSIIPSQRQDVQVEEEVSEGDG
jgi:hypothetical protein